MKTPTTTLSSQHPKSLPVLFFAELVERFSYWGTQSLLVLYLIHFFRFSHEHAYACYGAFTALTFAISLLGGLIADRFLGFKPSIMLGIIFTLIGNLFLAFPSAASHTLNLYIGLSLACYGTGIFIPNNSNLLGTFYASENKNRDRGFTLFYIGTNVGGLSGPVVYGFIAQSLGWQSAFITSAVMLALWFVFYFIKSNCLGLENQKNPQKLPFSPKRSVILFLVISTFFIAATIYLIKHPPYVGYLLYIAGATTLLALCTLAITLQKKEKLNLFFLIAMTLITLFFFACELQTNSSLIVFTQNYVQRTYFNLTIPAGSYAAFEPAFVIVSAAVLIRLWSWLGQYEPNAPNKMVLGLLLESAGFAVFTFAAIYALHHHEKVSLLWMALGALFLGAGEACIMPPLIAAVTHRAPPKLRGTLMGALYLAIAFSGYLTSLIASSIDNTKPTLSASSFQNAANFAYVYQKIAYASLVIALILGIGILIASKLIANMRKK